MGSGDTLPLAEEEEEEEDPYGGSTDEDEEMDTRGGDGSISHTYMYIPSGCPGFFPSQFVSMLIYHHQFLPPAVTTSYSCKN